MVKFNKFESCEYPPTTIFPRESISDAVMELGPIEPPIIRGKVVLKHWGVGITAVPVPVIELVVLPIIWKAVILAKTVLPGVNRYFVLNVETNIVH